MFGFFGRKDGRALKIKQAANLTKRVDALEEAEYERNAIAGGALSVGRVIFKRGNSLQSLPWRPSGGVGVIAGAASELRAYAAPVDLSESQAIRLRDWLLKEFPLETAAPAAPKKKGK